MKIIGLKILILINMIEPNFQDKLDKIFLGFTKKKSLEKEIAVSELNFSYQQNKLLLGDIKIEEIWQCSEYTFRYFEIPLENSEVTITTYKKSKKEPIKAFTTSIYLNFKDSKSALEIYSKFISTFSSPKIDVIEEIESIKDVGYIKVSEIKLNKKQKISVGYMESVLIETKHQYSLHMTYTYED
jgi:hypothetical protein